MERTEASTTALSVAKRRAAHQLFDGLPKVLDDPIAVKILGKSVAGRLRRSSIAERTQWATALRAFVVARSRFAEDELAKAYSRGTRQYVLLGAGLDTFAYRQEGKFPGLHVFEVDHPATQAWKCKRLKEADIRVPQNLTFVTLDFEKGDLLHSLQDAGFQMGSPAFFGWLGVVMYLTMPQLNGTLKSISETAKGGGVVFDYLLPYRHIPHVEKIAHKVLSNVVAAVGEPFRTLLLPGQVAGVLQGMGFTGVADLGRDEINDRYFRGRTDRLRIRGSLGRFVSAEV